MVEKVEIEVWKLRKQCGSAHDLYVPLKDIGKYIFVVLTSNDAFLARYYMPQEKYCTFRFMKQLLMGKRRLS